MGTNDHPIGEIGVKVNDNAYHVVRFTRSGANSTIQVDDYNVQTSHPEGNNLSSHLNYWGMYPVARVSIKYQNTSVHDKY
jgi:hypothetical protein